MYGLPFTTAHRLAALVARRYRRITLVHLRYIGTELILDHFGLCGQAVVVPLQLDYL